ncbi:7-cyano-7-deazaguanine synthase [Thioalkalivibrio sp. AKL10]|uniref:7-cyano-7-deazaguanine synthase n=1 Tax=Thioalkalivibrio sp. AKL10 TaxID=1158158 RepID=UPI00351019BC
MELSSIAEIKGRLHSFNRSAAERIGELKVLPVTEIPKNAEITEAFQRLRSRAHLGSQYDWLSRYAAHAGLNGIELSVHADDKAAVFLSGHVELSRDGAWVLNDMSDDIAIFSRFRFPLLSMTKREMASVAEKEGFRKLLDLSWFCYRPLGGEPCGACNPCVYTMEEGLTERFPFRSILRYKMVSLKRSIKKRVMVLRSGRLGR